MLKNDLQPTQTTTLASEAFKQIRLDREESQSQFGLALKQVIEPNAALGFTRQYINLLENGKQAIPHEIERAALVLAAMHDGIDAVQARARPANVLSIHDIEGALVLSPARRCALAGCRVRFIPNSPRQRFHSVMCRMEHYRRVRAKMQAV